MWMMALAALAGAAYLLGIRRLWSEAGRGRSIAPWRVGCFGAGLFTIALALGSRLDHWSETLFAAHMVQHLLLLLVAPPLLVLGAPFRATLWIWPSGARRSLGSWWGRRSWLQAALRQLERPAVAWGLNNLALLFWHLPAWYKAALEHPVVHALEHLSFLGTGILFWWVVLRPDGRHRLNYGASVLYLFTAALPSGLLGALLTFAGRALYGTQSAAAALWGLTPLEDQQLAGLIMWMPGGLVYLASAAVFFLVWLRTEDAVSPPDGIRRFHDVPWRRASRMFVWFLWVASVTTPIAACGGDDEPYHPVLGGNPDRGKQQIIAYGCGSCHVIPGIAQAHGLVGPPLTQFARRAYIAGEVPNQVSSLLQWISDPQSIEPGTAMPNLGVTQAQARDIAAYLYTLR